MECYDSTLSEYCYLMDRHKSNILSTLEVNKQIAEMNKALKLTKKSIFLSSSVLESSNEKLSVCKLSMKNCFIIRFDSNFRLLGQKSFKRLEKRNHKKYQSEEDFIDDIVLLCKMDCLHMNWENYESISGFKGIDLSNRCSYVCDMVSHRLNDLGIENEIVRINVGFSKKILVSSGLLYHDFVIFNLSGKKRIIDLTYSQFFMLCDNMIESLGIVKYPQPFPGIYMIQNESRANTARTLLNRGWMDLTDENLKNYCDGFALSFRNGLYYENIGKANYSTSYTADDYRHFLFSSESQVKKEGKEYIGIQNRPLKKYNFDFLSDIAIYENSCKRLVKTV